MGKLSGTVLIVAGLSIAAYTLSAQQDARPTGRADQASTTAANVVPAKPLLAPAATAPAAATPKPAAAPVSSAPDATTPLPPKAETPPPKAETPPAASPPPAALAPSPAPPQKLRAGTPPAVRVAEAPPRLPVGETAGTPSPPLDPPALTREIQRQLKRIGCYQGEANGVWSLSVRQAVKAVTDRINASLPNDRPDPVLLAMVQGQAPGTCAASCPKGQSRAADGRCLPAAIVASAGKQRNPTAQTQTGSAHTGSTQTALGKTDRTRSAAPAGDPALVAEAAAPPPSLEGRMSLAGPQAGTTANPSRQANARPQRQRARVTSSTPRATAYYRPPHQRIRQRSAQRSSVPFWASFPFLMP
jgi:hypothetical protein